MVQKWYKNGTVDVKIRFHKKFTNPATLDFTGVANISIKILALRT